MTQTAKVILDSISPEGKRLCTLQTRHFLTIHAEFMTHRVFSRNASSSRAIPVKKIIEMLRHDPALPLYWGSNKPGMQAGEEIPPEDIKIARELILQGMEDMITMANKLLELNLHKQIVNRYLGPWAHINVCVSATSYDNFYHLRNHPDADPSIRDLAVKMLEAMEDSTPTLLVPGQWHTPYVNIEGQTTDRDQIEDYITLNGVLRKVPMEHEIIEIANKVSVARCARTSYLTHDNKLSTVQEDIALFEKLLVSQPLHASPAEHQATPDTSSKVEKERWLNQTGDKTEHLGVFDQWDNQHLHGNFDGWCQYRRMLPGGIV